MGVFPVPPSALANQNGEINNRVKKEKKKETRKTSKRPLHLVPPSPQVEEDDDDTTVMVVSPKRKNIKVTIDLTEWDDSSCDEKDNE